MENKRIVWSAMLLTLAALAATAEGNINQQLIVVGVMAKIKSAGWAAFFQRRTFAVQTALHNSCSPRRRRASSGRILFTISREQGKGDRSIFFPKDICLYGATDYCGPASVCTPASVMSITVARNTFWAQTARETTLTVSPSRASCAAGRAVAVAQRNQHK